ncbi:RecB-family nuclease [Metallosphaera tengchongensis]|nr:RecB-family nuclease [Metallosphaera tengchongensis]
MVAIHNVTSAQRLVDFAKLTFGFNIDRLVITKIGGTAAQAGIPDVGRIAVKLGKSIMVLPDLKDAIELLSPRKVYLMSPLAEREIDYVDYKDNSLIVFSGIENGFTKIEQSLGEYVNIKGMKGDPGPIAYAGAVLYCTLALQK